MTGSLRTSKSSAPSSTSDFIPPALSVDLKQRIVALQSEGPTMHDIAEQVKVSVGSVHKTLRTYEECGELTDL